MNVIVCRLCSLKMSSVSLERQYDRPVYEDGALAVDYAFVL